MSPQPSDVRGGLVIATRINCARQDGPARNGSGLNGRGRPALPSQTPYLLPIYIIKKYII